MSEAIYNTIFFIYFYSSDSPMDKYQRVVLEEKYGLLEDLPECYLPGNNILYSTVYSVHLHSPQIVIQTVPTARVAAKIFVSSISQTISEIFNFVFREILLEFRDTKSKFGRNFRNFSKHELNFWAICF